ncbi:MAG: glycosyltransferase [Gemmatimonadaceae bacterium]|nr:glycosyltransferase [Gemmatimonadaceae bacterium]
MRILFVGDWEADIHEEPAYRALKTLGHEVRPFKWHSYFHAKHKPAERLSPDIISRKIQNKFLFGNRLRQLNRDFIAAAVAFRPEMVFVYRGTHVKKATLTGIKRELPSAVLVGYNNDDPFSRRQPGLLWRHFLASVPFYDLMLAYRQHNVADFLRIGAKRVEVLRSWFVPERNRLVALSPEDEARFGCDVAFIGHYEPDNRIECLEEIAKAGVALQLYGPDYPPKPVSDVLAHLWPVNPVRGEDYNKAVCATKIALCFLSKLNRDTYTRRCFEIPAAGTLLLSEYSDDLASLFEEGVEADFFRDKDELVRKIRHYLADGHARRSVAERGRARVIADGHDVESRMRQVVDWVEEIRNAAGG